MSATLKQPGPLIRFRPRLWRSVLAVMVVVLVVAIVSIQFYRHSMRPVAEPQSAAAATGRYIAALPQAHRFFAAVEKDDADTAWRMTSARFQTLVSKSALAQLIDLYRASPRFGEFELPVDGSRTPGALKFGHGQGFGGPALSITVVQENGDWRVDSVVLGANAIE